MVSSPAWQRVDRDGEIGDQKRLAHLVFGRVWVGIEQVGADGSLEQERLLRHQGHRLSQVGQLEVADVPAVEANGPAGLAVGVVSLGDVVKPGRQGKQGRLACTAGSQHADAHSRLDRQGHVVEHVGAVRRIRERHTAIGRGPRAARTIADGAGRSRTGSGSSKIS